MAPENNPADERQITQEEWMIRMILNKSQRPFAERTYEDRRAELTHWMQAIHDAMPPDVCPVVLIIAIAGTPEYMTARRNDDLKATIHALENTLAECKGALAEQEGTKTNG